MTPKAKRGPGRPPEADTVRNKPFQLRLTAEEHAALLRLGGSAWVRARLAAQAA